MSDVSTGAPLELEEVQKPLRSCSKTKNKRASQPSENMRDLEPASLETGELIPLSGDVIIPAVWTKSTDEPGKHRRNGNWKGI